ncbi:MAG: DUF2383 domain-containing protein [Myxococcota bacterium]
MKNVDQLNSFLRGEIAAVETYKMAIEKLAKTPHAATLRDNLRSHEDRVSQLRDQVIKYGGKPADGSGAWGTFAKLFEGTGAAFGERAAIAALEEGEDHGRNDYQRELEKVDASDRDFVQRLLAEQLRTHGTLSALKKSMRDDKSAGYQQR